MLVFSTKIPLREVTTRPQCVQLFIDWVVYAKRYPFEAKDFEGYDINGHENLDISKDGYTFSITFFKDDNLTLAACKLVTANESEVWTTLNVAVCEKDTKFLSVQTHCTKRTFSTFLPKAKPPYILMIGSIHSICKININQIVTLLGGGLYARITWSFIRRRDAAFFAKPNSIITL